MEMMFNDEKKRDSSQLASFFRSLFKDLEKEAGGDKPLMQSRFVRNSCLKKIKKRD